MDVIQAYEHELAITQGKLARAYMAIERVRELHRSYEWDNNVECVICPDTEYPCDTIKALDEVSEYPKGPVPRPEPEGENNE